ncbi:MAG: hypothetical protein HQK53_07830, partial [Oligoflexia bacterium]|nr:hypothetical protein [Oligoflexia bacterium]
MIKLKCAKKNNNTNNNKKDKKNISALITLTSGICLWCWCYFCYTYNLYAAAPNTTTIIEGNNGIFHIMEYTPYCSADLNKDPSEEYILAGVKIAMAYVPYNNDINSNSNLMNLKFVQVCKPHRLKDYEKKRAVNGWTIDASSCKSDPFYGIESTENASFVRTKNDIRMYDTPQDLAGRKSKANVTFVTLVYDQFNEEYIDAIKWGYRLRAPGQVSVIKIEQFSLDLGIGIGIGIGPRLILNQHNSKDSDKNLKIRKNIELSIHKWNEQVCYADIHPTQTSCSSTTSTQLTTMIPTLDHDIETEKQRIAELILQNQLL